LYKILFVFNAMREIRKCNVAFLLIDTSMCACGDDSLHIGLDRNDKIEVTNVDCDMQLGLSDTCAVVYPIHEYIYNPTMVT
jgi:hypothetical protein